MRASEILRKLADVIDSQETAGEEVSTATQTMGEPVEVNVEPMVPPLQQKLELLKKLSGIDDGTGGECEECGCNPCECNDEHPEIKIVDVGGQQPDHIDQMRKMAGIFAANDITG